MADENLLTVVHAVIAANPGAVAYRTLARNWKMREIADASDRIAQGLKSLGIGPGDRVAALTKHTTECILLTLAACKIGAVFMPAQQSGTPMTYTLGGRQYIVVAVSGGNYSGEYLAFTAGRQ